MIIKKYRLALITEVITQDTEKNTVDIKRLAETTLCRGSEEQVMDLGQDICFEFGENIEDIEDL